MAPVRSLARGREQEALDNKGEGGGARATGKLRMSAGSRAGPVAPCGWCGAPDGLLQCCGSEAAGRETGVEVRAWAFVHLSAVDARAGVRRVKQGGDARTGGPWRRHGVPIMSAETDGAAGLGSALD